jgi:hypothetical protein
MLIKIDILLSHVNVNKMGLVTCPSEQNKNKNTCKKILFEKTEKNQGLFFNPETETDPNQRQTFEEKNDPDPDGSQKVKPAGLYLFVTEIPDHPHQLNR